MKKGINLLTNFWFDKILKPVRGRKKCARLDCKVAFTLAEMLITIAIIGVVAALTLSGLTKKNQDFQFRMAYKKAYADINQAVREPLANGGFTRTSRWDNIAAAQELGALKEGLKVSKSFSKTKFYQCWAEGDIVCKYGCGDNLGFPNIHYSNSFIDSSGRTWAQFSDI